MAKKKKNKKNLQKNGNQSHKELIVVEGEAYQRLYDEHGNLPSQLTMAGFNKESLEEAMEELKAHGLIEVIEYKGIEYYRTLEP
ncbi:hypothetical protein BUZ69_11875 [Staphylococcus saprophyticus]|uniref:hypothetical protein n=1 Tax=Staphylococcus saprophyticus TaxID=29385 RepID=UPI000D1F7C11|nr:hypothetical protein [Staphylococcus saprophyticus]PTK45057.1 hypothetical protein BUZ69_11875 [Staphylococcus saprophyticus]